MQQALAQRPSNLLPDGSGLPRLPAAVAFPMFDITNLQPERLPPATLDAYVTLDALDLAPTPMNLLAIQWLQARQEMDECPLRVPVRMTM